MVLAVLIGILSLDQLTKFIISKSFKVGESFTVIERIFSLTLVHNRGAAFGIFRNQIYFFILTSLVAIVLIYAGIKRNKQNKSYTFALSLILAGALGNLIDRVFFGYVIDFLDFRIWPVFNLADSAITIGAILLGWQVLKGK
ncbi:MAG: signal peptidase II [Candidatus Omnitrophica bacterium]|nr:signal peptidase II [Candidatus Omnitrophota bacterium]